MKNLKMKTENIKKLGKIGFNYGWATLLIGGFFNLFILGMIGFLMISYSIGVENGVITN